MNPSMEWSGCPCPIIQASCTGESSCTGSQWIATHCQNYSRPVSGEIFFSCTVSGIASISLHESKSQGWTEYSPTGPSRWKGLFEFFYRLRNMKSVCRTHVRSFSWKTTWGRSVAVIWPNWQRGLHGMRRGNVEANFVALQAGDKLSTSKHYGFRPETSKPISRDACGLK